MNFMLLVARATSHSFAALTREILLLPLEHKIHIFSPPCNILYKNQLRKSREKFKSSNTRRFIINSDCIYTFPGDTQEKSNSLYLILTNKKLVSILHKLKTTQKLLYIHVLATVGDLARWNYNTQTSGISCPGIRLRAGDD